MKKILLWILLFPLSMTALGVSPPEVRTYPLVCRGGGDLHFNYVTHLATTNKPAIIINFMEKGQQKAGMNLENVTALKPGQCTWLDRPLHGDEPHQLLFSNINNFRITWRGNGRVVGIGESIPYVENLLNPSKYQEFSVYNDRKGSFIVTSIGRSI